jgi:hypothetical protein
MSVCIITNVYSKFINSLYVTCLTHYSLRIFITSLHFNLLLFVIDAAPTNKIENWTDKDWTVTVQFCVCYGKPPNNKINNIICRINIAGISGHDIGPKKRNMTPSQISFSSVLANKFVFGKKYWNFEDKPWGLLCDAQS